MNEQVDGDTEAASSLVESVFTIFGNIEMFIISIDGINKIVLMKILYLEQVGKFNNLAILSKIIFFRIEI